MPKSLVRRTRTDLLAIEVCTISRSVDATSVGTVCHGSPSKGEAAQVPTHDADEGLAAVHLQKQQKLR